MYYGAMLDYTQMSVRWKLGEYLKAHNITPYELHKKSGISKQAIYPLTNETPVGLKLDTLDRLLKALKEITGKIPQVSDLLEFVDSEDPQAS